VTNIVCKSRRYKRRRPNPKFSLFQTMTPAEMHEARAIAYQAALAVIG